MVAKWSRRVQQQDRKDQTTPLIGKGDLCLRSPQKLKIVWGPQPTSDVGTMNKEQKKGKI